MEITRHELYLFLQKSGASNLPSLKRATANLTSLIASDAAYTSFYFWNFKYYRDAQEGSKKFIPLPTASQVWAQILVPRYPDLLKHLTAFMNQYAHAWILCAALKSFVH